MPLAFPSWEGLGVGSSCLLPLASLLPVPCSLFPVPFAHDTINPEDARKCQTNIPTVLRPVLC
ncbi:hypothetical protein [Moorena producens]|uniref:hypothetical protein n=1 Tax=Moorena producens TaxID=1155739 RepID=UPI001314CC8C|nr:hypothetical protein [Moorena producens]